MIRTILHTSLAFIAFGFIFLGFKEPYTPPNTPETHFVALEKQSYTEEDLHWMVMNIYFEARNQPLAGMLAVGQVVLNRIEHPNYPKTVKDVITQAKLNSNGQPIRNKCQFSWYCDGKKDEINKTDKSYSKVEYAARLVLERRIPDLVDGATHYHTLKVKREWGYPLTTVIEDHIFYRKPTAKAKEKTL